MAPPNRRMCHIHTCKDGDDGQMPYRMRAILLSVELVIEDMTKHMTAHMQNKTTTPTSNKIPKLKVLTLSEECSETNWNQFQIQWDQFKRNTGLTGQRLTDQLWGCLSDPLEKAAINNGANLCINEAELLMRYFTKIM